MTIPSIVNNITAFACFVDLVIKENGWVHFSYLMEFFVSNVTEMVKFQQHVMAKVLEVDELRKRV